jgi:hypothetical protein
VVDNPVGANNHSPSQQRVNKSRLANVREGSKKFRSASLTGGKKNNTLFPFRETAARKTDP